jgi:hypothetical protein
MPTECSATLFACAAVGGGKLRMVERSPPKPMHCCWARRTVRLRDGVVCRVLHRCSHAGARELRAPESGRRPPLLWRVKILWY